MNFIKAEEKIRRFLMQQPSRFRFLTRLSVEKRSSARGGLLSTVEIILNEQPTPEGHRMNLWFLNSSELKIGDLNPTVGCMLVIRDISARGLECINYRVVDDEANAFSLNCEDFEFEIIT